MIAPAPVPIQQHAEELERVLDIYRSLAPHRVMEIGSLCGGTLYNWMMHAERNATVVSIDVPLTAEAEQARGSWQEWARVSGVTLVTWYANSHDEQTIKDAAQYAPYDFIFVDGDHSEQGVSADFRNYYPMLHEGGCMAFHDICAPDSSTHIGVGRWWRALVADGQYRTEEIVRDPDAGSAGIGLIWKGRE